LPRLPEDYQEAGGAAMNKQLTINQKIDGKWKGVNLHTFSGKPVRREVWESMEGQEIVGKLESDGVVMTYIAGTEELRDFYRGRGKKVLNWLEAAAKIEKARSELADGVTELPFLQEICRVMKGGEVQKIEY